ncbi:hypothetical protein SXCG_00142 [Synechococcus phage S-CAM8]|jgi:hypothetical protein|uniref:Gp171 n=2 Tax=Synechococcus phage S-CAM8 TaxID=754038 RepID=G8EY58_9CAUD|nr:hypothetical protein SXCG_00142 [Synechococcus phage S-CAM8]AET72748.1 gp171 [Synechococcus phage S-CAM8]AGN33986.1 hypothetical protein SXCG_00142 [Synechococcus phage S-CAM8]
MSVRIVRLRSGEDVICDLYEITTKEDPEKAVGFQMNSPYSVWVSVPPPPKLVAEDENEITTKISEPNINFQPWAPLSKEKSIMLKLDEVVTAFETHDEILQKYNKLVEVESGRRNGSGTGETDPTEG